MFTASNFSWSTWYFALARRPAYGALKNLGLGKVYGK